MGRGSSPRPYPALDVAIPFPSTPFSALSPWGQSTGAGLYLSGDRLCFRSEGNKRSRKVPDAFRKTGRWAPADPVRPSSLGLGLAAQVAPRAARHFTRPPGAFRTYSPDTPSHVFRGQGQATVGRQKMMRRGHPQKPGEGRGRDLYRRTPVPSLAPTGAPHSPHRPRPIQSGAGIALATG